MADGTGVTQDEIHRAMEALTLGELLKLRHFAAWRIRGLGRAGCGRTWEVLQTKDPTAAIVELESARPYELGQSLTTQGVTCLYPVYLRAEAYLAARQGNAAATEFKKVIDHRGLVLNCITGPLSCLGLARAYAISGDTPRRKRLTKA